MFHDFLRHTDERPPSRQLGSGSSGSTSHEHDWCCAGIDEFAVAGAFVLQPGNKTCAHFGANWVVPRKFSAVEPVESKLTSRVKMKSQRLGYAVRPERPIFNLTKYSIFPTQACLAVLRLKHGRGEMLRELRGRTRCLGIYKALGLHFHAAMSLIARRVRYRTRCETLLLD